MSGEKKPRKRFVEPSYAEAADYFESRPGFIGDPIHEGCKFVDHFISNGWKVGGKTKMVCWKASIRNWIRNKYD